jgi:translation elongation factor EF-Tu-like GTPase
MPIIDKFKDMGTVVMGKVESGTIRDGDSLLIMPNKVVFLGCCQFCPSILSSAFSYLLK